MTEFSEQVEEYILQDRQWPRSLRINHAKMQLARAIFNYEKMAGTHNTRDTVNFWRAILQRNED